MEIIFQWINFPIGTIHNETATTEAKGWQKRVFEKEARALNVWFFVCFDVSPKPTTPAEETEKSLKDHQKLVIPWLCTAGLIAWDSCNSAPFGNLHPLVPLEPPVFILVLRNCLFPTLLFMVSPRPLPPPSVTIYSSEQVPATHYSLSIGQRLDGNIAHGIQFPNQRWEGRLNCKMTLTIKARSCQTMRSYWSWNFPWLFQTGCLFSAIRKGLNIPKQINESEGCCTLQQHKFNIHKSRNPLVICVIESLKTKLRAEHGKNSCSKTSKLHVHRLFLAQSWR